MPRRRLGTHFAKAHVTWKPWFGKPDLKPASQEAGARLFADSELGNDGLIPFRVVLLQIVEQTSAPAYHHEKSAARAVVFLVRLEVFRQLTNALA
jgi:hypothetical protein